ncbi:nicotinate (nicotinamide) nucleotide adenylyltransferase [Rufibacter glacialis]|uniref:Probable nicotinate-nucleotide adenylyltransferase n=1 Tax=Rufibacter glacialis TaxID=1259555 RepID=A0A5M8QM22_9BACT|nr:nicotinate (nicotinamide) nucleotide adenylyltransferase [Rufibacter glacialis]KAA6437277.1 nicotinate-nucleotide adenylyltransferase [Rufibacter glacialis]GGK60477.1 putative nicotinate-nucleotide adenylyltransferase [Rufibacter glacialis]
MRVGLLFGSFNPIHIGHLILANYMATNTTLNTVWLVVSPQNPFKPSSSLLHEFDRLHMVRLAIADNADLGVTDIEFRMPKPSYTIDTLTYLKERYPTYQFVLIMGEDNLATLPKWKNYEQILDLYEVLVYPRAGSAKVPEELKEHPKVTMVPAPLLDISATFIRKCLKEGKSTRYLLPEPVAEYVQAKKLYQ